MSKNTDLGNLVNGLFVNSTRNVGVGTTTPRAKMEVDGAVYANAGFWSSDNYGFLIGDFAAGAAYTYLSGVGSTGAASFMSFSTNAGEKMRITSAGNVGIGTTTPTGTYGKLSVAGGISILNDNNAKLEIGRYSSGAANSYIKLGANSNSLRLTNNNDSADLVTFENGGNVGIGTTTPLAILEVRGANRAVSADGIFQVNSNNSQAADLGGSLSFGGVFTGTAVTEWAQISGRKENSTSSNYAGYLSFATRPMGGVNTERMRITSGGIVFVGTSSLTATGTFNAYSNNSNPAGRFVAGSGMADGNIALMVDKFSGTTSTSQWFLGFTISNQGAASGVITANGASQAAFGSWSDYRLKENITDLPSQLPNILALRPVEFDYIESEGGGHQISFIAQEFEQVFPDAVGERQDGMKTLTGWGKTEAILVKAIQELSAQVQELKTEIEILKQK